MFRIRLYVLLYRLVYIDVGGGNHFRKIEPVPKKYIIKLNILEKYTGISLTQQQKLWLVFISNHICSRNRVTVFEKGIMLSPRGDYYSLRGIITGIISFKGVIKNIFFYYVGKTNNL